MAGPLSPDDIAAAKRQHIPEAVFDAFNELLALKFTNGSATILQKDVLAKLEAGGMVRQEIFDNGWLNVEEAYRDAGWKVEYDKPAYNETYDASFKFRRA